MLSSSRPLTIGMVAGEASGDNLGAALVRSIQQIAPGSKLFGIGGPAMISEGFSSIRDMERLSVNGFVDPILRLPELINLLISVRNEVVTSGADCFVGIDSNFFNLLLAGMLRKRGIKTVHYVSPTVWAWRQGRVEKIRRNVDLMMTLYPFETDVYEQNGVPVVFVGHPKACEIGLLEGIEEKQNAREKLELPMRGTVVAILPGSRASEVKLSGQDFLKTAQLLSDRVDCFVIPAINHNRFMQLEQMLAEYPGLASKVRLVEGQSRLALTAADVVLVNSGTATLEAMLLKKPMVMSYRLGKISYSIISRLVKTDRFALPNILAERDLVAEFIQNAATPESLANALRSLLDADNHDALLQEFDLIHRMLRFDEVPGRAAATNVIKVARSEI